MVDPTPLSLGAVQETLLIPLYGRATFTRDHPALIEDPKSVEMVEALDYDFSRFENTTSLVGSVFRTRIFDRWVAAWLAEHPTGTVVEVGAGLNTRFERLDDGQARWFELDLPDVIEVRRRFFADTDRRTTLAASVLDTGWLDAVEATGGPWFFSAEAVLIYLDPADVTRVLATIGSRFPGSPVALDTWGTWMADHQGDHDTIGSMAAEFRWFCDDPAALDLPGVDIDLVERFTFVEAPADLPPAGRAAPGAPGGGRRLPDAQLPPEPPDPRSPTVSPRGPAPDPEEQP
ncbi:MAG: class I SAM-dependent methyltransferase [Acidimicrobiia bacterium]